MKLDNQIAVGSLKGYWLIQFTRWLWKCFRALIILLVILLLGLVAGGGRAEAARLCTQPEGWANLVKSDEELTCLAQNVYMEALGESDVGKLAVAWVTIRRSQIGGGWPTTICGVVWQSRQFSWTHDGCLYPNIKSKGWNDAWEIAGWALANRHRPTLKEFGVPEAQYFLNPVTSNPSAAHWMMSTHHMARRIGNHVFFRDYRIDRPSQEVAVETIPSLRGLRITRLATLFIAETVQALTRSDVRQPVRLAMNLGSEPEQLPDREERYAHEWSTLLAVAP